MNCQSPPVSVSCVPRARWSIKVSRVETQGRILRNLALVQNQLQFLSAHQLYSAHFIEELVQECLKVTTRREVENLNSISNNFPGIDLRSSDRTVGYQATLHVTKAKFDKTVAALASEVSRPSSRVSELVDVHVVGLTCVKNADIRRWSLVSQTVSSMRIRSIELNSILDLSKIDNDGLDDLDEVIQGFVDHWGHARTSDAEEVKKIVGWLDRPAIRDSRNAEMNWADMHGAMRSVRRLIAQGVDDLGHPFTRPRTTFADPYATQLKRIYVLSSQISQELRACLQAGSLPEQDSVDRIESMRLEIQKIVGEICLAAMIPPPVW